MEGSNKGNLKETVSYLEIRQAEFVRYLRSKYFSGKDIYGEEIFEKITVIDGTIIKSSRFSPTKSYEDPIAFLNDVTESKKKSLADAMNSKNTKETRIPPLKINSESTRKQIVEDTEEESSDSLQEISFDVWNEVQSAKKVGGSGVGTSTKWK